MKISRLKVDAYGAWTDLELEPLSDRVTVFYGRNEAGKTTLLQFIRAILYGFDADARRKYAATRSGRQPEGSLELVGPGGRFVVSRQGRREENGRREGTDDGKLSLRSVDGAMQGSYHLKNLLADIDETIFTNVFAVGLREMQELGTLSDSDAATALYSLTSALDRVSLIDVLRELGSSRRRLFPGDDGRRSQVGQILERRDRLRQQLHEASGLSAQWAKIDGTALAIDSQSERLETSNEELATRSHLLELAIGLRDRWQRRQRLMEELERLGSVARLDDETIDRLAKMTGKMEESRRLREQYRGQYQGLRMQREAIKINEPLWRHSPRIEALAEQQGWLQFLETRIHELEEGSAAQQTEHSSLGARLGVPAATLAALAESSGDVMSALRGPARLMQEAKQMLAAVEEEANIARETTASIENELGALSQEADLGSTMERAGERVTLLRRRIQIDEKISELERARRDLEGDTHDFIDRQMTPVWVSAWTGVGVVLAAILVVGGSLLDKPAANRFGWLLGAACVVVAVVRHVIEQSATEDLDTVQEQIDVIERQHKKLSLEREEIDAQLPPGSGPLTVRLQAAEKELASLEQYLPADTKRRTVRTEVQAADARLTAARESMERARRNWSDALVRAGLPANLSPKDLKSYQDQARQVLDMGQKIEEARQDLINRREEYQAIMARLNDLLSDTGLDRATGTSSDKIRRLVVASQQQETLAQQRQELRDQAREARRAAHDAGKEYARVERQVEALLKRVGAADIKEFSQLVDRHRRSKQVKTELAALRREIEAALGSHANEEQMVELLDQTPSEQLESEWERAGHRLEANRAELKRLALQRGQLAEQQRVLVDDRRLGQIRCELACVEGQLDEAIQDWQIHATTSQLLEKVRQDFEANRQPETLIEASGFLTQLTGGHYRRIWTPFGEESLFVEDADGQTWPVDHLSRGTREQLFLSLRLSLVSLYARRGVELPMILDDVLVNFDSVRTQAAARVLQEFSRQGHQLLVFTCHEHIWQIFKDLGMDARRLPSRDGLAEPEPVVVKPALVKPPEEKREEKRERKRERKREEKRPEPLVPLPVAEIVEEMRPIEIVKPTLRPAPVPVPAPPIVMAEIDEPEPIVAAPRIDIDIEQADDEFIFEEHQFDRAGRIARTVVYTPAAATSPAPMRDPEPQRVAGARGWEVEFESEWDEETEAA